MWSYRWGLELWLPRDPQVSQMTAGSPGPDGPADGRLITCPEPAQHHLLHRLAFKEKRDKNVC